MSKNANFTGQPILNQLLSFIPAHLVKCLAEKYNADYYCKTFYSYDHLVAMLYCCLHQCSGIREVTTGMQAVHSKLLHLGLHGIPRRSTLSDANARRDEAFFGELFHRLVKLHYGQLYPDSRMRRRLEDRMYLLDSTTIRLFTDILKAAGAKPLSGKAIGGMKAHTFMSVKDDLPHFVLLTAAAQNDKEVFKYLLLKPGDIIVFDKAYNSYYQFEKWTQNKVSYVTRLTATSKVTIIKQNPVSLKHEQAGVISDHVVMLGDDSNKRRPKIEARIVTFHDTDSGRTFKFLTNNMKWVPTTIASIYKQRWQVELLFKRIKQNFPLKSFLGESENAIKIQMWCVLISDLLIKIVKDTVRRKWSFSNVASLIKHHLMTYIDIFKFLENPDSALKIFEKIRAPDTSQLELFKRKGGLQIQF